MPSQAKPQYQVSLRLPDTTLTKKAASVIDALEKMQPQVIKSKAVLSVQFGTLKAEALFLPHQLKKLLINRTSKELFQKRMLGALK